MKFLKSKYNLILASCLVGGLALLPATGSAKVYTSGHVGLDIGAILTNAYHRSDISGEAVGIGGEPQAMLENQSLPGQREGEISPYYENGVLGIVRDEHGYALINKEGEIISDHYKEIIPNHDGSYRAKLDKKWYNLDSQGQITTIEKVKTEGLYPFKENKLYGFKNEHDEVVIQPQFKEIITPFSEGIAFVKNDRRKIVAIDEKGHELFIAPSDEIEPYENGLAEYRRHVNKIGLSAVLGRAFSDFGSGPYRSLGLIGSDNVKRGYIDRQGNIIIDSKLNRVYPMTSYGAIIEHKGKLSFVNRQGQDVIPAGKYEAEGFNLTHGYLALKDKENKKVGVKNLVNGETILPFAYEQVKFTTHNLAILTTDKFKEVVNMSQPQHILFKMSKDAEVHNFGTKGFMWVKNDALLHSADEILAKPAYDGYKVIDLQGHVIFEAKDLAVEKIGNFRHGISPVKINGKWGLLTAQGNWLLEPRYKSIIIL